MRKQKLIFLSLLTMIFLSMTGCDGNFSDKTVTVIETYDTGESMFVGVEVTRFWIIVYHKETKVMYAVSRTFHVVGESGWITDDLGGIIWIRKHLI